MERKSDEEEKKEQRIGLMEKKGTLCQKRGLKPNGDSNSSRAPSSCPCLKACFKF
jgi:hypothetical protein